MAMGFDSSENDPLKALPVSVMLNLSMTRQRMNPRIIKQRVQNPRHVTNTQANRWYACADVSVHSASFRIHAFHSSKELATEILRARVFRRQQLTS